MLAALSVLVPLLALVLPFERVGEPEAQPHPTTQRSADAPALVELQKRIAAGMPLDLDTWRTILIDQAHLRWRPRWPIARSFAVSVHLPMLQDGLMIELAPRTPGWKSAWGTCHDSRSYCMSFASESREDFQELGLLAADQREVLFDLRVWPASSPAAGPSVPRMQSVGTIRIDVQPVESVDEVLEPIADPLWGMRLARALRIENANYGAYLCFALEQEWPLGLGCSLDVSLLHDGRPVAAGQLWLYTTRGRGSLELPRLPRSIASGVDSASGWSLRFKGTSKRVLRSWSATRYWAGEIEVPLADLIRL